MMPKGVKKKSFLKKEALLLFCTIKKEIKALENFLLFLEKEKDILLKKDFPSLQEIEKERSKKLLLAKRLEKKRKKLSVSILQELKNVSNEKDESGIFYLLSHSHEINLSQLQSTLWELYQKVDLQRKKNNNLIKKSSGYIDNNMKEKRQTSLVAEP